MTKSQADKTEAGAKPKGARSLARRVAMQFLYALEVQGGANLNQVEAMIKECSVHFFDEDGDKAPGYIPTQTEQLAFRWIRQTWKHLGDIDATISAYSSNWKLNRISLVDRSILRLAVYQLKYCEDIPTTVTINEAVELAKEFSTNQAPGFINGLLDAIVKHPEVLSSQDKPEEDDASSETPE